MKIKNRAWVVPKCDCCGQATVLINQKGGLRRFVCYGCRRKILQDQQGCCIYLNYR